MLREGIKDKGEYRRDKEETCPIGKRTMTKNLPNRKMTKTCPKIKACPSRKMTKQFPMGKTMSQCGN